MARRCCCAEAVWHATVSRCGDLELPAEAASVCCGPVKSVAVWASCVRWCYDAVVLERRRVIVLGGVDVLE